jgi:hypothetical protein
MVNPAIARTGMMFMLQEAFATALLVGLTGLVLLFFVSLVRDIHLVMKGKD